MTTIYFVRHPLNGEVVYVGVTGDTEARERSYRAGRGATKAFSRWLKSEGRCFTFQARLTLPRKDALNLERMLISKLTELGCLLFNNGVRFH